MIYTLRDMKLTQRAIRTWLASRVDKDAPLGHPQQSHNCIIHAYLVSVLPDVKPNDINVGGVSLAVGSDYFTLPQYVIRWNDKMMELTHKSPIKYDATITVREATRAFREATRYEGL